MVERKHEAKAQECTVENPTAHPTAPSSVAENETAKAAGDHDVLRSIDNPPGNIRLYQRAFLDENPELDSSDDCHSDLPSDSWDSIRLMGRNSPGSRPEPLYAGSPVGYIPADQPGGPRDLPSGRYSCPAVDCHFSFGLDEEGYDRRSLVTHIGTNHRRPGELREMEQQVRDRAMALRFERDFAPTTEAYARAEGLLGDLIRDLDEIKEWEHARRFIVPDTALFSSSAWAWLEEKRLPGFEHDRAKEYQGSGLPPFRSRASRPGDKSGPSQTSEVASALTFQRRLEARRVKAPTSVDHGCRRFHRS